MRRRRFFFGSLVVVTIGLAPIACNVFVSLERCQSDADCPPQAFCDQEYAFCSRRDAATPDASEEDVTTPLTDAVEAPEADVVDAAVDAGPCNLEAPFGIPALVSGLDAVEITSARLGKDPATTMETMVISVYNGCQNDACVDLFLTTRSSAAAPFGMPIPMPGVNTTIASEYWGTISDDGSLIFLESSRSLQKVNGSYVGDRSRIWSASRSSSHTQFSDPTIQDIFQVDAGAYEGSPHLHPNGHVLYFSSTGRGGSGGVDIYVAQLAPYGSAKSITNVTSINSERDELIPFISFDERVLYFARDTPSGSRDIMVSKRKTATDVFGAPSTVSELAVSVANVAQWPSWLSDDQCELYFVSNRPTDGGTTLGPYHLWTTSHPK